MLTSDTIIFIDNYFTKPKLAMALKAKRIAVCRAMKPSQSNLPALLVKMKKVFAKYVLYRVLASVIQNDILHVSLKDNSLVLALITAYGVREVNDTVSKKRNYSSKTSTNSRVILPAFQENEQPVSEKGFAIPKLFYYYNKHIEEVNQFNALVAAYTSQWACN